jgi:hypothetical protein
MAGNRRVEPVSYTPFRAQPLLSEGLLAVSREGGGELQARVAAGLARIADEAGQKADAEAKRAGMLAGQRAAMDAGPQTGAFSGGQVTGTASSNGQAGHVRGAQGGVRVAVAPAEIRSMIGSAAQKHGVDPVALERVAGLESSFNPNARNPSSSAGGLFQFLDGTATQYGLRNRYDPAEASDAAARLMRDNRDSLRAALGRDPTAGELYLAHQQGAGGAQKLLSNPNARAVDVVGADAVRLNGGNEAMTAGEFAAMWTRKAGGGSYTTLPSAASVEPVSVVPVQSEQVRQPGAGGGFRPSGADTVYGRAYDVAGTQTFLEQADQVMLEEQAQVYEAYKDNPDMLRKSLDELLTAHKQEFVFAEIAPDYEMAFRKRANGLMTRAQAEKKQRDGEVNRMQFLGRMEDLETLKSQRLAGLDANDPSAAAELADLQTSIDAHYDSAVARGVLDLSEAERFKRKSRSDAVVGFYTTQAARKSADDIKAMRADMARDWADGGIDGVSGDDWGRIEQGLAGAETARRTQDEKSNADLRKRGDDLAKRVAAGLPVTPDEFARFQLDARTAPEGARIVNGTLVRLRVSEAIRTQPIGAVEKNLKALVGEDASADDIAFAQTAISAHKKDVAADPLGVAERFGVLPVSGGLPLDGDISPDAVSGAFAERINAARAAANHFGVQPKYFRPGEAEAIEQAVKTDPERGLAMAAGLVDAAGPEADRVLRELNEAAPAVSLSGGLIAMGGSKKAALDLIAGMGKTPDGKAYPDMVQTKRIPLAQESAGVALSFSPSEVNRLDQAAAAIARKRMYDAGVDPKKDDAKSYYERAYQEAAGASFAGETQFGGFGEYKRGWSYRAQKVLLPPTVRADKFPDLVGALTDADLGGVTAKNGKAWTAHDVQGAMPVAVKGGYAFARGDVSGDPMFIADAAGNLVVLDLEAMRPVLEPRVPGAYR